MSSYELNGYDSSDFASFDQEAEPVQQLPTLPIDEVLPKADESINKKKVSFEDPENEPQIQAIIPQEPKKEPKTDIYTKVNEFLAENSIYLFVILVLAIIYLYNKYY
jgi:hypothetical protein